MSVILDALKKLDREKSLRRPATANIHLEILRPDLPQPENKIFRYGVIILLTAIGTGVITYFTLISFMKESPPPSPMISSAPSEKVIPAPQESDLPLKTSAPPKVDSPAPVYRDPLQGTRKEISQAPTKIEGSQQSKGSIEDKGLSEGIPPPIPLGEKKTSQTVLPEKQETHDKSGTSKDPQTQGVGFPITPSLLKVSAIVWYEDPSMRFAIINGLKVTEGSLVEGVRVVEIKPTSVRLFHNERYFELSIER